MKLTTGEVAAVWLEIACKSERGPHQSKSPGFVRRLTKKKKGDCLVVLCCDRWIGSRNWSGVLHVVLLLRKGAVIDSDLCLNHAERGLLRDLEEEEVANCCSILECRRRLPGRTLLQLAKQQGRLRADTVGFSNSGFQTGIKDKELCFIQFFWGSCCLRRRPYKAVVQCMLPLYCSRSSGRCRSGLLRPSSEPRQRLLFDSEFCN